MALWKSSCEAVSIVILPCCICAHFALPARKMDIASSIMSHSNRSRNPHSLCPTCDLDQSFLLLTLEVSLLLERPLPLVDFPLAKKVSCGIPFRFPGRKLGTLLSHATWRNICCSHYALSLFAKWWRRTFAVVFYVEPCGPLEAYRCGLLRRCETSPRFLRKKASHRSVVLPHKFGMRSVGCSTLQVWRLVISQEAFQPCLWLYLEGLLANVLNCGRYCISLLFWPSGSVRRFLHVPVRFFWYFGLDLRFEKTFDSWFSFEETSSLS